MSEIPFWRRLKRARAFQVLILYLGASWFVLQLVDVLQNTLGLPEWVGPVALILLVIGLIIVLATAWIQSSARVSEQAQAGQVPGAWEVAAGGILESLKNGEMPHLTWARSLVGGLVAFWFLFGLGGLYVVVKDRGQSFAPEEAVAEDVPTGIAVVPFSVSGPELDVWREGMVDLLSTNLDGVGGFRSIDSRTVLARWNEVVPEGRDPDLEAALEVARRTGARYVLLGTAVSLGGNVRLVSDIYDVSTGEEIGQGQVEGSLDDVMSLVDRLAVESMRALLEAGGQGDLPPMRRTAHLTTESVDALRAYLEGEKHYRRSEWPKAVEMYERAVEEDSTFALALFRLSDAYGWLENIGSEKAYEYLEQALRHVDRLPAREAAIVTGLQGLLRGDLSVVPGLQDAAKRYPDDPEAAFQLAEWYYHYSGPLLVSTDEAEEMLVRAVSLDPTFGPYYIHLIEIVLARGDTIRGRELLDEYRRVSPGSEAHAYLDYGRRIYTGTEEERAEAMAGLDTLSFGLLDQLLNEFIWRADDMEAQDRMLQAHRARPGSNFGLGQRFATWTNQGKFGQVQGALRDSVETEVTRAIEYYAFHFFGGDVDDEELGSALAPDTCTAPNGHVSTECSVRVGFYAAETADWTTHGEMLRRNRDELESLADQAGQERHAESHEVALGALEGYAELIRGSPREAIRILEPVAGRGSGPTAWVRWWLAVAHQANGNPLAAIRYYESQRTGAARAEATLRLASLYEDLDRPDDARAAYESFLRMWKDADPDLPRLRQAREGLERVSG